MNLWFQIDSDAAYLVESQAHSRVAGYFQLNSGKPDTLYTNGALLVECKTLRHVVASSAEAETARVFHNAQTAVPIRYMLQHLGHSQQPTLIKTDNATTYNFIHDNITQKKSKSWDMRNFWLWDWQQQKQFQFHWERGTNNKADNFTKHHTEKHHRHVRNTYVQDIISPNTLNSVRLSCKGVLEPPGFPQPNMASDGEIGYDISHPRWHNSQVDNHS